eukprot:c57305_g1_i1.p1 GENE.c57305_g1_i1~~c57305_g1_i1.p1  ORF type:complete len:175 (+),score=49.64 c57305_g1_i1:112-636(+)
MAAERENPELIAMYKSVMDSVHASTLAELKKAGIAEQYADELRTMWITNLEALAGTSLAPQIGAAPAHGRGVPQLDGFGDDDDDDELLGDDGGGGGSGGGGAAALEGEELLGSDLDDDEDGSVNDEVTSNVVLCQTDNGIKRKKNKWTLQLKDGVACINGKDYVFHSATGSFNW